MRVHTPLLLLALVLPLTAFAQFDYDRHVAFDNSLTSGSFYYSQGFFIAPSELELVHNKFPVEENASVTPPNSLRLKWRSRTGGDWHMTLNVRARDGMQPLDEKLLQLFFRPEFGFSSWNQVP